MKKRLWVPFAIIAVSTILAATFFASANIGISQEPNSQLDLPVSIQQVTPQYLTSPPNFPNNSYKITKIFLEKATLWRDSPDGSLAIDEGFPVPTGMTFFVVNGTIRNDYSPAEIIALSKEGLSKCTIGLDIYLYDVEGNFINTIHRGNPFRGCYEVSLRGSEKANFEAVFAAPEENIAYIEIFVRFLNPLPLF